jgi:hypothetical protein
MAAVDYSVEEALCITIGLGDKVRNVEAIP